MTKNGLFHFLIIDDDVAVGECISLILSSLGFVTSYFSDPLKAVFSFRENPKKYQAVFTDLRMPKMHGDEVISHIREYDIKIPIIIVTATTAATYHAADLQRLHIPAIISKPFEIRDIEQAAFLCQEQSTASKQYSSILNEYVKVDQSDSKQSHNIRQNNL